VQSINSRLTNGTTGIGFIDGSLREVIHTDYTWTQHWQNVASFHANHLHIELRIGAEWYEHILIEYDASSNLGNWKYLAGVGSDSCGTRRIFMIVLSRL
jgi:deoxyribodipyrimidine photo-lyase